MASRGLRGWTQDRWAPGVWALLVWTALMWCFYAFAATVVKALGSGNLWLAIAFSFGGMVGCGYGAHKSYVHARDALVADPVLRGYWLTHNAWWVVPFLGAVVPVTVAVLVWLG